ncbi:MAG TPA: hypothetical protein DCS07_15015 [Bdellovibrionales bacterium]|nr:hypothetical protein [Bdellovibrionales bacterium]
MKANLTQWILCTALITGWVTGIGGCSTTQLTPAPAPVAKPPPYVQVPHPVGTDLGDLRGIMLVPDAPTPESLKKCDADFAKIRSLTTSEDERRQAARELVKRDPVGYHWCYYGKLLELLETLKTSSYIDERQKKAIDTYLFLVPVARGFLAEYHDSRYLRWAIVHYRRISEWVFFRRMDLSPEGTSELVQVANPFGLWRDPTPQTTILEKYGIVKLSTDAVAGAEVKKIFSEPISDSASAEPATATAAIIETTTAPQAERVPASEPAVSASAEPVAPEWFPAIEAPVQ